MEGNKSIQINRTIMFAVQSEVMDYVIQVNFRNLYVFVIADTLWVKAGPMMDGKSALKIGLKN